jgi:hypothetical protein
MPEVEIRELGNNLVITILSNAATVEEASRVVADVGDRYAVSRAEGVVLEAHPAIDRSFLGRYLLRAVTILVELEGGKIRRPT